MLLVSPLYFRVFFFFWWRVASLFFYTFLSKGTIYERRKIIFVTARDASQLSSEVTSWPPGKNADDQILDDERFPYVFLSSPAEDEEEEEEAMA